MGVGGGGGASCSTLNIPLLTGSNGVCCLVSAGSLLVRRCITIRFPFFASFLSLLSWNQLGSAG